MANQIHTLSKSLLTDLVSVTERGDIEHMSLLLSLGVRPDLIDTSSGYSALHASVQHNPSLLRTLLKYAADPDGPWVMCGTPLSYAVHELGEKPDADRKQELLEAIGLLLRAGADPQRGAADLSPLELAGLYDMPEVYALLLEGVKGKS